MSADATGPPGPQHPGASSAEPAPALVLPPVVQVYPDREALAEAAADRVATLLAGAIAERGAAALALAGGSTPRPVYERLARAAAADESKGQAGPSVDWSRVDVYWGDERAVPPDHEASNYRMVREALLEHVDVAPGHVHRVRGERPAAEAARLYEVELILTLGGRSTGPEEDPSGGTDDDTHGEDTHGEDTHGDDDTAYRQLKEGRRQLRDEQRRRGLGALHLDRVRLDLSLLGLGDDGHTASLFPAAFAGHETDPDFDPHPRNLAAATLAPDEPHDRISLTLSSLSAARRTVFLVSGEAKAEAVARVLAARAELDARIVAQAEGRKVPPLTAPIPPAARVRPTKAPALWMLDLAAASRLPAPEA